MTSNAGNADQCLTAEYDKTTANNVEDMDELALCSKTISMSTKLTKLLWTTYMYILSRCKYGPVFHFLGETCITARRILYE